jgi:hypothetical protein
MERVHKVKNLGIKMANAIPDNSVVDYAGSYSPF